MCRASRLTSLPLLATVLRDALTVCALPPQSDLYQTECLCLHTGNNSAAVDRDDLARNGIASRGDIHRVREDRRRACLHHSSCAPPIRFATVPIFCCLPTRPRSCSVRSITAHIASWRMAVKGIDPCPTVLQDASSVGLAPKAGLLRKRSLSGHRVDETMEPAAAPRPVRRIRRLHAISSPQPYERTRLASASRGCCSPDHGSEVCSRCVGNL